MAKYVIKRILLMFFTLFVIMTVCFVLVKLLEPNEILDVTQAEREDLLGQMYGNALGLLDRQPTQWQRANADLLAGA